MITKRQFLKGAGALAAATMLAPTLFSTVARAQAANTPAVNGKFIRTVKGPLPPEKLGITSMHEHVLRNAVPNLEELAKLFDEETLAAAGSVLGPSEIPERFFPDNPNHPITLENLSYLRHYYAQAENGMVLDKELMVAELGDFAALGGKSILDLGITWERADPLQVREMSEQTGLNIVMSTGLNSHTLIPKQFKVMSVAELSAYFEKELTEGIGESGILAGSIKLLAEGENTGLSALNDEALLRGVEAAANASRSTGAPTTIHAYALGDSEYIEFLNALKQRGIEGERTILSHFDTTLRPLDYETLMSDPKAFVPNLDIGFRAMDRGFIASFDLFGAGFAGSDTESGQVPHYDLYSLAAVKQFAEAGYADRIVLGTDVWMRIGTRRNGGAGIAHLLNYVVPTLKKYGVSQADIDKMLVGNPARLLAY